jgi:succinoglycan biosynthesis protein ExoA
VSQKSKKINTRSKPVSTRGKGQKGLVSVVIPVEPDGTAQACLKALHSLPRAEKGLIGQVWLAQGRHPSLQRNRAVAKAQGRWILFLDSDSRLETGALPQLLAAAESLGAVAVGGPNLALTDEPAWGRRFQRVQASWLGSMSSRARYTPVGKSRLAGEKELILCNLLMDREAFLKSGGFREDLYPNEENELFNRLESRGLRLAYEPDAWVRRPRRKNLRAFIRQAFGYGRGRAQQMRANFHRGDLVNLLPLALPLFWVPVLLWPIPAAAILVLAMGRTRLLLPLAAVRHHAYAAGLLAGFFQNAAPRPREVALKRMPWPR